RSLDLAAVPALLFAFGTSAATVAAVTALQGEGRVAYFAGAAAVVPVPVPPLPLVPADPDPPAGGVGEVPPPPLPEPEEHPASITVTAAAQASRAAVRGVRRRRGAAVRRRW